MKEMTWVLALGFVVWAGWMDWRSARIPNWLTVPGFLLGLVVNTVPAGAGLPAAIPEGSRALSVAVNDVVAVAGFVMPGTMVDVLVTGSVNGNSGGQSITRTILENIRVMA